MENIVIEDRKKIAVSGATKVISSTSTQAVVEIGDCNIVFAGTNLEVTKLDLENKFVSFSGDVNSFKYIHKAEKRGLLKRLFK